MTETRFTGTAYYQQLAENALKGSRCQSCGALHVPPRALCPDCYGGELEWEQLEGNGTLAAFTSVYIAPTAMIEAGYGRKNPYVVGIVRLAEGPAISGQIVGVDPAQPEAIEIGMPLRASFVERGEGDNRRTFLAFEPGP
jgi:uncharacterized OB-fold protein